MKKRDSQNEFRDLENDLNNLSDDNSPVYQDEETRIMNYQSEKPPLDYGFGLNQ